MGHECRSGNPGHLKCRLIGTLPNLRHHSRFVHAIPFQKLSQPWEFGYFPSRASVEQHVHKHFLSPVGHALVNLTEKGTAASPNQSCGAHRTEWTSATSKSRAAQRAHAWMCPGEKVSFRKAIPSVGEAGPRGSTRGMDGAGVERTVASGPWTRGQRDAGNSSVRGSPIQRRGPALPVRLPCRVGTAVGAERGMGTDCGCSDGRHGYAGTSPGSAGQFP